jgi:hypothetical protein
MIAQRMSIVIKAYLVLVIKRYNREQGKLE